MTRVESEESQDYVCEMLAISREEVEEIAFVPSASGEPRGSIYFCDIGEPLMHVRTLSSLSSLFPSALFSFVSLFIFISLHLVSLLLSASVCVALCCVVLRCAVLCCCVWLHVVVLFVCVRLCASLCHVSGVEQCIQVKRTNGGLGNVLFST